MSQGSQGIRMTSRCWGKEQKQGFPGASGDVKVEVCPPECYANKFVLS